MKFRLEMDVDDATTLRDALRATADDMDKWPADPQDEGSVPNPAGGARLGRWYWGDGEWDETMPFASKTRDVTSLGPGDRMVVTNEGGVVHVAIERKQQGSGAARPAAADQKKGGT